MALPLLCIALSPFYWLGWNIYAWDRAHVYNDFLKMVGNILKMNSITNLKREWLNKLIWNINVQKEPCKNGDFLYEMPWRGSRHNMNYDRIKQKTKPFFYLRKVWNKYLCRDPQRLDDLSYRDLE